MSDMSSGGAITMLRSELWVKEHNSAYLQQDARDNLAGPSGGTTASRGQRIDSCINWDTRDRTVRRDGLPALGLPAVTVHRGQGVLSNPWTYAVAVERWVQPAGARSGAITTADERTVVTERSRRSMAQSWVVV